MTALCESRRSDALRSLTAAAAAVGASTLALLSGCAAPAGESEADIAAAMTPARPAALARCTDLGTTFTFAGAVIDSAAWVAAGTLAVAGRPIAEHCLVSGKMNERVSAVDGQTYAIGFQMRLPRDWNGRFFHQGNGGLDGVVAPAVGLVGGGGERTNALDQGFAVLSSDAGHNLRQVPLFGRDPQARLDYGYRAVANLTPMAKALIAAAYGKAPDRSYFGGCSNGGRHAMVAAARDAADYDGFLAGDPGFHLPQAAVAQLFGAQQYARLATTPDLASAFTPAERQLIASRVLARCDALDGAADGLVADTASCQRAFDPVRDLPVCHGARDGTCLSQAQIGALARVYAGASDSRGRPLYAPFPWDPGVTGSDWAAWKFVYSVTHRDPVAVAYVFQTPPADDSAAADPKAFALAFDIDSAASRLHARDARYTEASMDFMTPPDVNGLAALQSRGAKLIVYHGAGDPVFSALDSVAWYEQFDQRSGGHADRSARLYLIPGMNHCRGGPATDQFDLLSPLVDWVEQGRAPQAVTAQARGVGNPVPNPEVPPSWAPDRSRLLCPFPQVARYRGAGDVERAASFTCAGP